MPGVPPDAVAQIKKGLRGLFGRKKKNKSEATPSSDANTGSAVLPGASASASSAPPATQSYPNPPLPQPSAPPLAEKAGATSPSSGPAAPYPSEPQPQTAASPKSSPSGEVKEPTATGTAGKSPAQQATNGGTGMSATSGPLDDLEYSDPGRDGTGAVVPVEGTGVGSTSKPVNIDAFKT